MLHTFSGQLPLFSHTSLHAGAGETLLYPLTATKKARKRKTPTHGDEPNRPDETNGRRRERRGDERLGDGRVGDRRARCGGRARQRREEVGDEGGHPSSFLKGGGRRRAFERGAAKREREGRRRRVKKIKKEEVLVVDFLAHSLFSTSKKSSRVDNQNKPARSSTALAPEPSKLSAAHSGDQF